MESLSYVSTCYPRSELRGDALYQYFRFREVYLSVSKTSGSVTRIVDDWAQDMVRLGLADDARLALYYAKVLERFADMAEFDSCSPLEIYRCVCSIRSKIFGDALTKLGLLQAANGIDFHPAIDQSKRKSDLIAQSHTLTVVLTQPALTSLMESDLQNAAGKRILFSDVLPKVSEGAVLYYGEDGLLECRNLPVPAVVTAVPVGYHAQALTGLWNGEGCIVYIPPHYDITPYVPLINKSRLTFSHLALLEKDFGDRIYTQNIDELYQNYPQYFMNFYANAPSGLPVCPKSAQNTEDFDRRLDNALSDYLHSFPNLEYTATYFNETLQRLPICYEVGKKQTGILVHTARIKQSERAKVMQCPKNGTPRTMFASLPLPGTALVSNFLFFMTPKLGLLYNALRSDRPYEQTDAAAGHLDYMLAFCDGKRIESFPLFGKTCIAMDDNGHFHFFNFFLGGGSADLSGITYRWESHDVNNSGENELGKICVYTPLYSLPDSEADRNTYRKPIGHGRVNIILIQEKIVCIRRGDVLLPSVGVVLSLAEEIAEPLLQKCTPLEDGYYVVDNLKLTVQLDAPADIPESDWARIQWAYGGGLTLIRNGSGLCDNDHMQEWFETEGWTSPLSRQTQESNLHSLVKHPRTAIGCCRNGDLLVLVFSGRTRRSTGADYQEMIEITRQLYPDVDYLMNADGGGSAMLGLVHEGELLELSYPSTSTYSCAGQVRPVNTVFYIPVDKNEQNNPY